MSVYNPNVFFASFVHSFAAHDRFKGIVQECFSQDSFLSDKGKHSVAAHDCVKGIVQDCFSQDSFLSDKGKHLSPHLRHCLRFSPAGHRTRRCHGG